jgi:hypothetical protein
MLRSRFGQAFGIGGLAALGFACSGSAFREGSEGAAGTNAKVDETTKNSSDVINTRPRGGGQGGGAPLSPMPDETAGGAPDVVPDLVGGTATGGAAGSEGGATGGMGTTGGIANAAGTSAGGVAGTTQGEGGTAGAPIVVGPPGCDSPVTEDWSQPLGPSNRWELTWGDPRVDTANHRLVLSYDDIVLRRAELTGGYYVTTEVTILGETAFTPYLWTKDVNLPSIRKNAEGSGMDFGIMYYAHSDTWSSTGWQNGATGHAGGDKMLVTVYVRNGTDKGQALKVVYENKVYRSEWVTYFNDWPDTNLGKLRYVGENNSSAYGVVEDKIYVGPIVGCQNLSDAAVTALFNQ